MNLSRIIAIPKANGRVTTRCNICIIFVEILLGIEELETINKKWNP